MSALSADRRKQPCTLPAHVERRRENRPDRIGCSIRGRHAWEYVNAPEDNGVHPDYEQTCTDCGASRVFCL